jgi:hypothetical protein
MDPEGNPRPRRSVGGSYPVRPGARGPRVFRLALQPSRPGDLPVGEPPSATGTSDQARLVAEGACSFWDCRCGQNSEPIPPGAVTMKSRASSSPETFGIRARTGRHPHAADHLLAAPELEQRDFARSSLPASGTKLSTKSGQLFVPGSPVNVPSAPPSRPLRWLHESRLICQSLRRARHLDRIR